VPVDTDGAAGAAAPPPAPVATDGAGVVIGPPLAAPSRARGDTEVVDPGLADLDALPAGVDCEGVRRASGSVASARAFETACSTGSSAQPARRTASPTPEPAMTPSMPRRPRAVAVNDPTPVRDVAAGASAAPGRMTDEGSGGAQPCPDAGGVPDGSGRSNRTSSCRPCTVPALHCLASAGRHRRQTEHSAQVNDHVAWSRLRQGQVSRPQGDRRGGRPGPPS
jgi:hypothetical protein